jgi:hypothetical protein
VDAFLLEDLGGADAFPRRRDLDQHAVALGAGGLVHRDEVATLLDGRLRVVREARIDLGRHAARHDREDAQAELDGEAVEREADDLALHATGLLLRPRERAVDDVRVLGHLRGGGDQRRIRGRVPRRELLDRVEIAGVAHRDGHRVELIE